MASDSVAVGGADGVSVLATGDFEIVVVSTGETAGCDDFVGSDVAVDVAIVSDVLAVVGEGDCVVNFASIWVLQLASVRREKLLRITIR